MNLPVMSELRWALLILGVVFVAVLAWWERRRPRQASGAEGATRLVREPPLTLPEVHVREPAPAPALTQALPVVEPMREESSERVFEPALPVRQVVAAEAADAAVAADAPGPQRQHAPAEAADEDTMDDLLAIVPAEEIPAEERATFDDSDSFPASRPEPVASPSAPMPREALPELPPGTPLRVDWPAEHERRILALRLVAPQRERFAGRSLRQALAAEGFLLGQFAIFHKPDDERRAVLSAASLTRPGTFDMETMDSQHYGGLSLFAVLPGPKSPPQAFDELVFAARNLNERLHGVLQDEQGTPLTPARIAQLREQLRAGVRS